MIRHEMAVINHDAEFYENASEDLIDELVEKELASMKIDLEDDEADVEVNKYLYKSLSKSKDYDDDDDIVIANESTYLPEPKVSNCERAFFF